VDVDRRRGLLDDIPVWCAADIDAWADWVKRFRDGPGGGSGSIIWWMMEAKRTGIWARGTSVEPTMPENIAAVDSAASQLDDKREQKAFFAYYLQYARAEDKARYCHCAVPTFYGRLKRARRKVADCLVREKNPA
jgi:hypothetical protein